MQLNKLLLLLIIYFLSNNEALPLNKLFTGQDKICTNNYADGQVSIRSAIRQLLGIPKHHFLSKQVNKWIIPTEYTGFKIMKRHSLKNGVATLFSDITLNYCQEGELLWSKNINSENDSDDTNLLWSEPMCTYYNPEDSSFYNENDQFNKTTGRWNKLKEWTLETTKIKIKPKTKGITLKDKALSDVSNLRCYKVARNKKYALQNLNIFLPNQFIGGIFKCDLSEQQSLLNDYLDENLQWVKKSTNVSIAVKNFCTVNNSKPLLPLIGDKFENYWSEYNGLKKSNDKFHVNIVKTFPFLYTPHILDSTSQTPNNSTHGNDLILKDFDSVEWTHTLKYRILDKFRTKSKDHHQHNWYNELSVNENYTVGLNEMNKLEKLTNKLLLKLQDIAQSDHFKKKDLAEDIKVESLSYEKKPLKQSIIKRLPKKLMFSALSFEDKLTNMLAEKFLSKTIKDLVHENDKLKFHNEYFEYDL